MTATIPPYPRHLTLAEREAVRHATARAMVDEAIAEKGIDRSKVGMERLLPDAMMAVTTKWLIDRVADLEAEVSTLRAGKDKKGAR